jgi:hypothetical protein
MKLTQEEWDKLKAKRQVINALGSWVDLLDYLGKLVDQDIDNYTQLTVRKRLGLGKKKQLQVNLETGEVNAAKLSKNESK